MILVTGAAGKTGQAVILALAQADKPVRAMVHSAEQAQGLQPSTTLQVVTGDLLDAQALDAAMRGVEAVYYICPNMSLDEVKMGRLALQSAQTSGVKHFVYHSVLHPQVEAMPHHWNKMRVEELIFASHLPFTILQPTAYMQNMLAYWQQITQEGLFTNPYNPKSRLSLVDLADVARAAALVIGDLTNAAATYELVGTLPMSQVEVAAVIASRLGKPVEAKAIDRNVWEQNARAAGLQEYAVSTLKLMFEYYENYGLQGNPRVLRSLLGRAPCSLEGFIDKILLEKA